MEKSAEVTAGTMEFDAETGVGSVVMEEQPMIVVGVSMINGSLTMNLVGVAGDALLDAHPLSASRPATNANNNKTTRFIFRLHPAIV